MNENYCYVVITLINMLYINYLLLLTILLHSFIIIVVMECVWYFYDLYIILIN